MTPTQILHYAIGELAYTMAAADGEVQKAERQTFHDIVRAAVEEERLAAEFSVQMFQMADKEERTLKKAYSRAMSYIRLHRTHFTPALQRLTIKIMKRLALAFPPVTDEEKALIARFEQDLTEIVVKTT